MDHFEVFTQAGMSKKEAAIYVALLDKGVLTLSDISKETHINRPALYTLLPKMQRDGVVSQVQKQKRIYYQAESPARILEAFKAQSTEVATQIAEIAQTHTAHVADKPVIKYFEGMKGVTFVFDDIAHTLPKGSTFFRYTSRTGNTQNLAHTYYAKVRDAHQLERMVITSEEKAKGKEKKLERAVKVVPKEFDLFEDNISLVIYGDKTAYIDYTSNTSFIVESPKIARFQEKLFRLLYKKLDAK